MPHYRHDVYIKRRKIRGNRTDTTVVAVARIVLGPYTLIDRLLPSTASFTPMVFEAENLPEGAGRTCACSDSRGQSLYNFHLKLGTDIIHTMSILLVISDFGLSHTI